MRHVELGKLVCECVDLLSVGWGLNAARGRRQGSAEKDRIVSSSEAHVFATGRGSGTRMPVSPPRRIRPEQAKCQIDPRQTSKALAGYDPCRTMAETSNIVWTSSMCSRRVCRSRSPSIPPVLALFMRHAIGLQKKLFL